MARALSGIFGGSYAAAQAAIADITAPEERARNFGFVGAAFGVGFVAGPAIGGFLGEIGPRAPFVAAAILAAANMLYGYFIFPETLPRERRRTFDWRRRASPLARGERCARCPEWTASPGARAVADRQPRLSDDVELFIASRSSAGAPA